MGVSVVPPVIKGIDDYKGTQIDHAFVQISAATHQIETFTVHFELPDFSSLPSIFNRKVTANLQFIFDKTDHTKSQSYLNINSLFTFEEQNYFSVTAYKAFDNLHIKFIDETIISPE
jgi:hypothetical protein